jgi:SHO1 osmosensor
MIAFVSSIIADVQGDYPNYCWWSLAFMLLCIVSVFVTVAMDSVHTYHVALVGLFSAGLVFTTSSVNSLIYYSDAAKEAAAAGFILLSMVSVCMVLPNLSVYTSLQDSQMVWIFYYGSQPTASHRRTLDSFALHKEGAPSRSSRYMSQHQHRPDTIRSSSHQPQMYNANQLAGFETSSPVTGFAGGAAGQQNRASASAFPQPASTPGVSAPPTGVAESQQQTEFDYPYRAKAIYSYEANPDDSNEVSFAKHEILEVSDVSGRWWQAKKENGDKGIIPSNYVRLSHAASFCVPSTNTFPGRPHIITSLTKRVSKTTKPFHDCWREGPYRKRFPSLLLLSTVRCCEKSFHLARRFESLAPGLHWNWTCCCFFPIMCEYESVAALDRSAAGWPCRLLFLFFSFCLCFFVLALLLRMRVTIPRETILLFSSLGDVSYRCDYFAS